MADEPHLKLGGDDVVLTLTSGGCNSLHLAINGARRVGLRGTGGGAGEAGQGPASFCGRTGGGAQRLSAALQPACPPARPPPHTHASTRSTPQHTRTRTRRCTAWTATRRSRRCWS